MSDCVKHRHSNNDIQKAANKPAVNQRRFFSDISTHIPLFLRDALVGRQVCFSVPYFHSYAFLPLLSVTKDKVMVSHLHTVDVLFFGSLIVKNKDGALSFH